MAASDCTHPNGESSNEQADGDEGQNVINEIGHGDSSSLFTYVYYLFYLCSKVNPIKRAVMNLRFMKYKRQTPAA